jgi:hypothetical protein
MKMVASCAATNDAGSSSEPTHGSDNSVGCWSIMSIFSSLTGPSSISPASGLHSGGVYETPSSLMA